MLTADAALMGRIMEGEEVVDGVMRVWSGGDGTTSLWGNVRVMVGKGKCGLVIMGR